jgi:hypothetical protein
MVSTEEQKTDSTRMTRESVAGAAAGVIEAGVAVPGDLTFSGYCNFPHRPKVPFLSGVLAMMSGNYCRSSLR